MKNWIIVEYTDGIKVDFRNGHTTWFDKKKGWTKSAVQDLEGRLNSVVA